MSPPPPLHNTSNHCLGIRNHFVSQFPCKSYWNPPFITQTTTLWLDGTTVWVNSYVNTARNHCGGHSPSKNYWTTILWTPCLPSVSPPPPPLHNTLNDSVVRRNQCVGQFLRKYYTVPLLENQKLNTIKLVSSYWLIQLYSSIKENTGLPQHREVASYLLEFQTFQWTGAIATSRGGKLFVGTFRWWQYIW